MRAHLVGLRRAEQILDRANALVTEGKVTRTPDVYSRRNGRGGEWLLDPENGFIVVLARGGFMP